MDFDLLKRICETPGVPGREEAMRRLVAAELRGLVDEVTTDAMGNLIGVKRGSGGPRVMLAAHMDEIGFVVKHIDERGFLRIHPLGGWDPRTMMAQRVYVHGSQGSTLLGALMPAAKPIHMLSPEDAARSPKIDEFFVDLGMPCDEVKQQIEIGDPVTMARTAELVGRNVLSKTLDARVAVYVMIAALRLLGEHQCDILAVATCQEEVGLRGATTSAYDLKPDVGIAIDVTLANDYPGGEEQNRVTELGKGAAIKIMDSSLLCNPKLVRHFRDVAERHAIPHQLEILQRGGTDAGAIQRSRSGVPSFTLSIPCRYVHSVNEMAAVSDIDAAATLLARYLEDAHTRSYGYEEALSA